MIFLGFKRYIICGVFFCVAMLIGAQEGPVYLKVNARTQEQLGYYTLITDIEINIPDNIDKIKFSENQRFAAILANGTIYVWDLFERTLVREDSPMRGILRLDYIPTNSGGIITSVVNLTTFERSIQIKGDEIIDDGELVIDSSLSSLYYNNVSFLLAATSDDPIFDIQIISMSTGRQLKYSNVDIPFTIIGGTDEYFLILNGNNIQRMNANGNIIDTVVTISKSQTPLSVVFDQDNDVIIYSSEAENGFSITEYSIQQNRQTELKSFIDIAPILLYPEGVIQNLLELISLINNAK
jgi:hypothetical protein